MSSLTKLNKVSDKMVRLSRNDKHLYKSAVKINKLIKELKGGAMPVQNRVIRTVKTSLDAIKEKLKSLTTNPQNGNNLQNGNNPQTRQNPINCNTCMKQRCSNCVNKKLNNRTPISKLLSHGMNSMSPHQNNPQ
jgi:hypothetical protein